MEPIGKTLRKLRLMHGYQQPEVVVKLNNLGIDANQQKISRWENDRNSPTVEQFLGLCTVYGIKDVFSVFGKQDFSEIAQSLNREGQRKLEEYRKLLVASRLYMPETEMYEFRKMARRQLQLFSAAVSAGTGQFLDSDDYEMIDVPEDVPLSANFAVRVCGDSMEPTLHDHDIIWVHMQPAVEDGEIGIFCLDGDAYVKELRVEKDGAYLVSHNESYAPIRIEEESSIRTYGKVVFPIR